MFPSTKYVFVAIAFTVVTILLLTHRELAIDYYGDLQTSRYPDALRAQRMDHGVHEIGKKMERYDLSRQECGNMFPALNSEIEIAKSRGRIGKVPQRDEEHGFLRGRIHNNNVG
jgi:hypothetical protein